MTGEIWCLTGDGLEWTKVELRWILSSPDLSSKEWTPARQFSR